MAIDVNGKYYVGPWEKCPEGLEFVKCCVNCRYGYHERNPETEEIYCTYLPPKRPQSSHDIGRKYKDYRKRRERVWKKFYDWSTGRDVQSCNKCPKWEIHSCYRHGVECCKPRRPYARTM